jgi:hypothetical protein
MSVGFPFIGNIKKPFADGFTDGICVPKKKSFPLEIYQQILFRR